MKFVKTSMTMFSLLVIFSSYVVVLAQQHNSEEKLINNMVKFIQFAKQVTIYRDTYWVPHIFGKTDEACAFGIGYAQADITV